MSATSRSTPRGPCSRTSSSGRPSTTRSTDRRCSAAGSVRRNPEDGRTIRDANNVNFSYLSDPAVNAKLDAAAATTGSARADAYAKLDEEITRDVSPLVVWGVDNDRDFFSSNVGCILHHPVYGIDIATMCKNASS
jgi:hypothetical protein